MLESHTYTLPGQPESVAEARHWLREVLSLTRSGPAAPEETIATAVLLTSELVTNAITHTATGQGGKLILGTGLRRRNGVLHVTVEDDGASTAPQPEAPDPAAERGRGLLLVDTLADDWGPLEATSGTFFSLFFPSAWGARPPEPPMNSPTPAVARLRPEEVRVSDQRPRGIVLTLAPGAQVELRPGADDHADQRKWLDRVHEAVGLARALMDDPRSGPVAEEGAY